MDLPENLISLRLYGELDIRLKNRLKRFKKSKYRKLKISLLLQTVLITALTVLVGGFLLKYIIDGVYNDDVSEIFIGFLKFFHVKEQDASRFTGGSLEIIRHSL